MSVARCESPRKSAKRGESSEAQRGKNKLFLVYAEHAFAEKASVSEKANIKVVLTAVGGVKIFSN